MQKRTRLHLVVPFAIGAAILSALTMPAGAGTYTLSGSPFSAAGCPSTCSGSFTPAAPEVGSISDSFAFQISSGLVLNTDSVTNAFVAAGAQINGFELQLFHNSGSAAAPVADGAAIFTANGSFSPGASTGTQFAGGPSVTLSSLIDSGNYFLLVTGTTVGTCAGVAQTPCANLTQYSGSYSFIATAVPEPATWGMMLLGFVGLGFAFRRSGRKVSFA